MRHALASTLALSVLLASACSGNKQAASPAEASAAAVKKPAPAPAAKPTAVVARSADRAEAIDYAPVYFEFDSTTLRADARPRLDAMAEALQRQPSLQLTIEGHADERGTTEYNMSLGERRAQVVRDYLKAMGAPTGQLRIVSYGEERPAMAGQDEQAWARNRRSAFVPADSNGPTASR